MAQADYVVSNGTGAAVRADLNGQLAAIVTNNSGATSPATTYAYQWWADTTTNTLKLRNSANNAWIEIMQLDGTLTMEDGTAALPGLAFRDDLDTGIFRAGTNQLGISSAGVERVEFGSSEVVFNDAGNNYDFRVEGDTNANLFFVDASTDRVGIGTSSVSNTLDVRATGANVGIRSTTSGQNQYIFLSNTADSTNAFISQTGSELRLQQQDNVSGSRITFYTKDIERVRITDTGLVGIGTTAAQSKLCVGNGASTNDGLSITFTGDNSVLAKFYADTTTGQVLIGGTSASYYPVFYSANSERARIDTSGRLLVGTTSARTWAGITGQFLLEGTGFNSSSPFFIANSNDFYGAFLLLGKTRGTSVGSNTVVQNNDYLGEISFAGGDGSTLRQGAGITAYVDGTPGASDMPGRLVFSTTADGASSPTERMRISQAGFLSVGNTTSFTDKHVIQHPAQTQGNQNVEFTNCLKAFVGSGGYGNAAACSILINSNNATGRAINAGGTINALGADYAEYMVKAGDFTITKGDVCGITADGLLTNKFADAFSFVVKSTNPSYVGGDTWGSENAIGPKPDAGDSEALAQWETDLEAARQLVDRIAFAGQVPVNISNATPGQYIVPIATEDGGITGIAKNEADLTLTEYMRAVGKVIAIEDDGRARIIVKVA